MMATDDSYNYKVLLLGTWSVGKTSLLRNFVREKFEEDYVPTLGANVLVQDLVVEHGGDSKHVVLTIWEIAGQDRFIKLRSGYYFGARGTFLVGDLTNPRSFAELARYNAEFRQYSKEPKSPAIMLANKCDLPTSVSDEALGEFAVQLGVTDILKTSALTGTNVDLAFEILVRRILDITHPLSR